LFRTVPDDEISLSLYTTFTECSKDHRPFDRIPKLENDDDMSASAAQLILQQNIQEENRFRMSKHQKTPEIVSDNIK
jgi:hypothetical protein